MASPLGAEHGVRPPHPEPERVKEIVVPNFKRVRVFDVTV
jgi:hypothetical protein